MGSGPKNQTTTTKTDIPAFLQPLLTQQANVGQSALGSLQSQLQGAGAPQLVSPFTPNQVQGQQMAVDAATGPQAQLSQNVLSNVANGGYLNRMLPTVTQGFQNAINNSAAPQISTNQPDLRAVTTDLTRFGNEIQMPGQAQDLLNQATNTNYLYGNPAFDEAVNASIRQAQPVIASTFAGAGSGGLKSGLAQTAMQQAASDSFARLFDSERSRQLNAQLGAAGQLGNFALSGRGLAQGALGQQQGAELQQQGAELQRQQLIQNAQLANQRAQQERAAQQLQATMAFGSLLSGERGRQLQAAGMLPASSLFGADVLQNVGGIQQAQNQTELTAPINAAQMLYGASQSLPTGSLLGQTSSQPIYRNTGAGILGGAGAGMQIGATLGGPLGAGLGALGGGLLGGFF